MNHKVKNNGYALLKSDSDILKALFISAIVFHNFFHVLPNLNIENEFDYKSSRVEYFLNNLNFDPLNFIPLFFSYLGHYGVQLFIFISVFGMMVTTRNKVLKPEIFLWKRITKIYPTFFLAVCMFAGLTILSQKHIDGDFIFYCFLRLTMLSNFFPGQSFVPVGPWWFYSMIVQFYIIFPFLKFLFRRYGMMPLYVLSLISIGTQITFNDALIEKGFFLRTTILGHLPLISFAMYFGHKERITIGIWQFLIAIIIFTAGNFIAQFWYLTQVSIVVITLFLYGNLKPRMNIIKPLLRNPLYYIGAMSMYIFAVNGFLRRNFVAHYLDSSSVLTKIMTVLVFLLFVMTVAILLKFMEGILLKFLNQITIRIARFQFVVHKKPDI